MDDENALDGDDRELPFDGEKLDGLRTRQHRERWLQFLLQSEGLEWNECQLVYDEHQNMVLRVRWPDGSQVAFDLKVRREMLVVKSEEERERN